MLFFSASSSVKRLAFTSHVLAQSFLHMIYPHIGIHTYTFTSISFRPWPKLTSVEKLLISPSVVLPLRLSQSIPYFRSFRYNRGYPLWSQIVTVPKKHSSINVLMTDLLSDVVSQLSRLCERLETNWCLFNLACFFSVSNKIKSKK